MARMCSEQAVEQIGNRFNLILVASIRARELAAGAKPMSRHEASHCVTALREIEEGHVGVSYLNKIKKK